MMPLNISVVGAGYWGKKVIREILNVSRTTRRVNLCSVVDNSPSMLEQCRKEFGPLDYRLSYQGLLSDPAISAVHICSPNTTHFEVASEFLRSKKHVLVEKPLALRSTDANELVRLAEEKHRVLAVGHVHRFNNGLNELKRIVQSGLLGDIYYLRLQWTGYLPPQRDRDVITDLGPHPFDICNNILGTWPTKISCRGRGYRGGAGDEVAFIIAEHIDGVNASIELSWLDSEKHRDVTVVGSNAVARLDCLDQKLVLQRSDKTETISTVPSNTLQGEIIHFARCVENDTASKPYSNLSDGSIGAGVVRLLEASRRSLLEERTVQVPVPSSEELVVGEPAQIGFRKITSY
ncbi:MAG TPA: Gfo/Idh/MocA family oxidoreductase [Candidatus Bathyarchaeia archaeon]|nr:Gfo/Idh/MocA family oxidoreductase [Candidatus Bathyarchaeia archaeon]